MKLSDAKCRTARPGDAPYKLADGYGLYLFVATNGSRLWRLDYRFNRKRFTLSFGPYPDIGLAEARAARDVARKQLRDGLNPVQERRLAQATAQISRATTFGLIADELLAKLEREKKAAVTIEKRRWLLKDLAAPLCDRPVAAITPIEILSLLRVIEGRGHLETARRLRASIGQVMRLAVITSRAASDPTTALRGAIAAPVATHRAAITDLDGARRLMLAIDSYDRPVVRASMLIMAYCFPRPGECRQARWNEVDLAARVWTIPAERTKMRREHKIPLSRQSLAVFEDLKTRTGHREQGLCFPGQRGQDRPISENTICVALRTLGFAKEEMSAHGFRALASSLLHEQSDFSSDAIERSLAHQDQNAIRRAYARGQYWDERVRLAQWWADYLDRLMGRASVAAA
ncbi:MAG: integrase arm-type DNA-binding domain-containing protein [Alphaproteobacteria bacterium]